MSGPVLEVLRRRIETGVKNDGKKLGLVVEGGGMRGVVSASAVAYLAERGYLEYFDKAYGTSAGAINLAYIVSGKPWRGIAVYYDHLATKGFVDVRRAARLGPVISLDLVKNHIFTAEAEHLIADDLAAGPVPIAVTISDITNNRRLQLDSFTSDADLHEKLVLGSHIPLLCGLKLPTSEVSPFDGSAFLADGGLFYGHPIYAAIEDGCTHALSFETRSLDPKPGVKPGAQPKIVRAYLNRYRKGAGDTYMDALVKYFTDRDKTGLGDSELDGVFVHRSGVPDREQPVTRSTTDRAALLEGSRVGYRSALEMFEGKSDCVHMVGRETLSDYDRSLKQ